MDARTAQRLAKIAPLQTLTLTHQGRKSGKTYDVVIWFVVEGERMFLATANKSRNWARNVLVKPNVVIKVSGENFTATVSAITDKALRDHVTNLVQAKYWYAMAFIMVGRLLQNLGIMQDNSGAFEVHLDPQG
jgi:deazaflavin-dependent oxidoreductase (nitroreductase family)